MLVVLPLVAALAPLAGCCSTPPLPPKRAIGQLNSPEVTYALLRQSVEREQPTLFVYLLDYDTRRRINYSQLDAFFGDFCKKLRPVVLESRLLRVVYLPPAESPFPPRPAARVELEYPHPERGLVNESFLLVLERGGGSYDDIENLPQWRIHYDR